MALKTKVQDELEKFQADEDDLDIDKSDYGFIISNTGELKTFFCPDDVNGWPPKEILKIFKIFKITDLSELLPGSNTLH